MLTDLGIVGAKWEAAWMVERTEAGTVAVCRILDLILRAVGSH